MTLEEHSRLIRDAACTALSPLGFQQKGRSRVWYADRDFWMHIIEFQPSGFRRGSYLNIAASWLWHPDKSLAFNYFHRAGRFIEFETAEQFKPEAQKLAELAAAEAIALDEKFDSLDAVARYLNEQAKDERAGTNPWTLYHAAITTGLIGNREFGLKCFTELIGQRPTVGWMKDIQSEAASLTKLLAVGTGFHAAIRKKVADKRTALKLPPLADPAGQ